MFGLLPYSYRFRWFDIKEGTRHFSFFFFFIYQVACYLSAEETKILQELMYKNLSHAPVSSML